MVGPRPRRRRLLVFAVAVTGIVVALMANSAASTHPIASEAVQAYLDQVRPGVQRSTEDGADFTDIRNSASKLGRDGVDRRIDRLASSVDTTLTSIDSLTPPQSLRVAHAYLVASLGVRLKAVRAARGAFDQALTLGAGPDQGLAAAVQALVGVGQDVGLGDRAMGLFTGALPSKVDVPTAGPWLAAPADWEPSAVNLFVVSLRAAVSVTPVHDLALVAFQTDPPAVSVQDGAEIIPAGKPVSVSIVVQNVGNQPERNVEVDVVLTLGGGVTQRLRDFVDLAPAQRRAVGPLVALHPPAGSSGTLTVSVLPVPGETDLQNSTLSTPVQFRA